MIEEHGGLDAVVTAAGTDACGDILDVDADAWERVVAVNLLGTAAVVRAALPALERSRGRVVTVASTLGLRALPAATAYCASKFGVVGFTRALASELGDRVGVTLLVPGGMQTHFFDDRPDDFKPAPDQHLNDPADVARTVVFALRQPAGLRAARAAGGAGHRAVLAVSRPVLLAYRALGLGDFLTGSPRCARCAPPSRRTELVLAAPAALAPLVRARGVVDEARGHGAARAGRRPGPTSP